VLFSAEPGTFTHYVPVAETAENSDIMTELWVEYEDGVRSDGLERPWPYVILGGAVQEVAIPEQEFADEFDFDRTEDPVQSLNEKAVASILNSYGGFESYLRERERSEDVSPSGIAVEDNPSVQEVVDLLLEVTEADLPAIEEEGGMADIKRKKRDQAFREGIYEIYPGCAICGKLFESPEGSLDIEAAHILPKAENGPDVLQNGLGLCSRHHWAFDQGWFEIGLDYQIHVREFSELEGYDGLQTYDGEHLYLPDEESLQPHPHYLQQRNQLHE
jgi:putative restriction endonuclease